MPFYMVLDPVDGTAYGVFLFNSNAMDVLLQPNAITYRVIGGVLDFYIFTGPRPADVVSQYMDLVGHPRQVPRWALGFHLCRWGYNSLNQTMAIWQSMQTERMPQDSQWNDIDYMDNHLDFTVDPVQYPLAPFRSFVDSLHEKYGMKYMMIFDPGISSTQQPGSYPAYVTIFNQLADSMMMSAEFAGGIKASTNAYL
jgi:lysosomal alpha-glucosidase